MEREEERKKEIMNESIKVRKSGKDKEREKQRNKEEKRRRN